MVECCWLWQLLQQLHILVPLVTVVYYHNVSIVYMMATLVRQRRTKHIEIDTHFVHEKVVLGQVHVLHAPSAYQVVDIMTKALPI